MKSEIRRIAFTCDFLRSHFEHGQFQNSQYGNLEWLYVILGAEQWNLRWGVDVNVVVPELEAAQFRKAVANDAVFQAYERGTEQVWPSLYDVDEVRPAFGEVFDRLGEYDLIIGFELPPTIKRNLDRDGKRYISLHIHPVRFLRDLCFFAVTNWPHAQSLFDQLDIPSSEIEIQGRRWRALLSRRRDLAVQMPRALPMVVGQTRKDAAVINNGVFTNLASYGDQLATLLEPYSQVLFLGHPFESRNSNSIEYLRSVHKKSVISLEANGYIAIFSPSQISSVITISSSLGIEAASVGHATKFLLASPIEHLTTEGVDLRGGKMIGHALLTDFFGDTLFRAAPENGLVRGHKRSESDDFFLGANYLRSSLESWSFAGLQRAMDTGRIRKKIFPAAALQSDEIEILKNEHRCRSSGNQASLDADLGALHDPAVEVYSKPCSPGSDFRLDFSVSTVQHHLVEGFRTPESWGVWCIGREGCVQIPVDLGGLNEGLLLIEMSFFMVEALLPLAPVLSVKVGGRDAAMVLFRAATGPRQRVQVITDALSPICELRLTVTHTTDDLEDATRYEQTLGFALCELQCSIRERDDDVPDSARASTSVAIFGAVEGQPVFCKKV